MIRPKDNKARVNSGHINVSVQYKGREDAILPFSGTGFLQLSNAFGKKSYETPLLRQVFKVLIKFYYLIKFCYKILYFEYFLQFTRKSIFFPY